MVYRHTPFNHKVYSLVTADVLLSALRVVVASVSKASGKRGFPQTLGLRTHLSNTAGRSPLDYICQDCGSGRTLNANAVISRF